MKDNHTIRVTLIIAARDRHALHVREGSAVGAPDSHHRAARDGVGTDLFVRRPSALAPAPIAKVPGNVAAEVTGHGENSSTCSSDL